MLKEGIIILSSSLHAWEVLAVPASREPTAWRKTAQSARGAKTNSRAPGGSEILEI